MFNDRKDAGKKLALALEKYKNQNTIVLAIPKGGIEVGYEVAKHLNADFSLIVVRKLPYPENPEAGFGAIAEDGSCFIYPDGTIGLLKEQIERIKKEQKEEIKRRIKILRKGKRLPKISGRITILIDDGLAMGSTMRAAVMLCKKKKAGKIIVAVPVAGKRVASEMKKYANKIVVLEIPEYFQAVAQVYREWHDVSDEEAMSIMKKFKKTF